MALIGADRERVNENAAFSIRERHVYVFFALFYIAFMAPAIFNVYPLSADYLNHLSRIFIYYNSDNLFLNEIFDHKLEIIPNLALDIFAFVSKPLGLDPNLVIKIFFIMSSMLVWIGVVSFYKAVHGAINLPAILAIPVCYSFVAAYGFLNFSFGAGIFLIVFSWLIWAKPSFAVSFLALNLAGVVLFFSHFGAVLIMIVSIFLFRIGDGRPWPRAAAMMAAESALPFGLYLFRVPNNFSSIYFTGVPVKLWALVSAFQTSSASAAFLSAVLFAILFALLLRAGAVRLPPRWRPLVGGLAVLSFIAPFGLQASFFTDWRLIWMTFLFALLTIEVDMTFKWSEVIIVGVIFSILTLQVRTLFHDTAVFNRSVNEFAKAIEVIPRNSFVFASTYDRGSCARIESPAAEEQNAGDDDVDFIFYHSMPALVTVMRSSVYPFIFAHRGAEAIFFRPKFAKYFSETPRGPVDSLIAAFFVTGASIPIDWNAEHRVAGSILGDMPMAASALLQGWSQRFSYVVHMAPSCPERGPYAGMFPEVARGHFFTIYRVASAQAGHE